MITNRTRIVILSLAVFLLLPALAHAKTMRFINNSGYDIYVAYVYQYTPDGEWWVRGWYKVPRGGTINRELDTNNKYIYIYAKTWSGDRVWSGSWDDGRNITQEIVNEAMNFRRGRIPKGTNHRKVRFRMLNSGDNGFWEFKFGN